MADARELGDIVIKVGSEAGDILSRRVVANAQQMHGGIGFTKDYRIQLFFRRQKAAELAWGDADYHRDQLGVLLGV